MWKILVLITFSVLHGDLVMKHLHQSFPCGHFSGEPKLACIIGIYNRKCENLCSSKIIIASSKKYVSGELAYLGLNSAYRVIMQFLNTCDCQKSLIVSTLMGLR